MLITQSGKFQNFEFESLAGIASNTWQTKSSQIEFTVKITIAVRPVTVAMLLDGATVEPNPLCPDPSREKGRGRGRQHPGPPLFFLCSLHVTDRHARASTDPQHAAAETKAPQHASEVAVPGVA
jgi:hypothetical protein